MYFAPEPEHAAKKYCSAQDENLAWISKSSLDRQSGQLAEFMRSSGTFLPCHMQVFELSRFGGCCQSNHKFHILYKGCTPWAGLWRWWWDQEEKSTGLVLYAGLINLSLWDFVPLLRQTNHLSIKNGSFVLERAHPRLKPETVTAPSVVISYIHLLIIVPQKEQVL